MIWYEILFVVNMISKKLPSKFICIEQVRGIISFEKYKEEGFAASLEIAKSVALEMNVEPNHPTSVVRTTRKTHFDEIGEDVEIQLAHDMFQIDYFLVVVDIAISSLETRFEQLKAFENILDFCLIPTS